MKNYRTTALLLACILLLQCLVMPASGAPVENETEPSDESTEVTVPVVPYGNATVANGCRTIEGMYPLGGSDRILESAQAAFIYETTTQTVIYSYNPDLQLAPGSLSKMLTALIAIEMGKLDDEITVSTREISQLPVGAITAKLKEGEKITVRDALYQLILASANDAALILAEYIAGDEPRFVEVMNQRLAELGCTNTYLVNCHGLDNSQQYTTARDIARITLAASQNPTFMEIFGAKTYDMPPTNKNEKVREVTSGNHLKYEMVLPQFNDLRVTGGMPSYVSAASGASIAFTAEDKNMELVYVILGATRTYNEESGNAKYYGNFEEALDLLAFSFNNYKISRLLYQGQALNQFEVSGGECDVVGSSETLLDTVLPINARMDNLIVRYTIRNGGLKAPIADNEVIGTVQYWYNTSCVAETEMYAMNPVKAVGNTGVEIFGASRDDSDLGDILKFLGILLLVVIALFGGYIGYGYLRRSMNRARRRRRRASRRRSR